MKRKVKNRKTAPKIGLLFIALLLFFVGRNVLYVHRNGVVKGIYQDNLQRKYVCYNGEKYYEYRKRLNHTSSLYELRCEVTEKVGFAIKSIIDYLPAPDLFRYGFWSIKYDSNHEYLLHLGMQSDDRVIYVREDVMDKLYKNKIIMTFDEYEIAFEKNDYDKEDYTEEEINSYVLNDNYGDLAVIDNEKGEHIFVMDKPYLGVLNNIRTAQGKKVEFNKDILFQNSYQLRFYENELPKPKLSDYLLVINDQYIYVRLNENDKDNTKVIGTIIEDESVIESIEDGGKQIFTKENGVTIDNVEYVNG